MARVSKKRGERSGARSGLGSGRAGERMSTVLSGSAQPGAAAGLYSHSSQPYIQRLGIAGVSIQRLQAVPTPCRPLERAVPVPCQRAGIAAQARARGRAVLGTGTGEAGRAVFVPGQISIVPVLARWAWPVWKSLPSTKASPGCIQPYLVFYKWENWFYSIERWQESENTIKKALLRKIPLKDENVT